MRRGSWRNRSGARCRSAGGRGGRVWKPCSYRFSPSCARGPEDGANDPGVGAAAAEAARETLFDLLGGGMGRSIEQRLRGDDHAVGAVAALGGLLGDEGGLEAARLFGRSHPFERGDGTARGFGDWGNTRSYGLAVQEDGAGAALAQAASELGAVQAEAVPQDVE